MNDLGLGVVVSMKDAFSRNAHRIQSSMQSLDASVAAASENMTRNLDRIQKGTMMIGAGLAALVRQGLAQDPLSGSLFVFVGRRADRLKILYWDRDGYALWAKRLERGTFRLPSAAAGSVMLTGAELAMLLEGIELAGMRRRKRLVRAIDNR